MGTQADHKISSMDEAHWFRWHSLDSWKALLGTTELSSDPLAVSQFMQAEYVGVTAYHGCRSRDNYSYFERGIVPMPLEDGLREAAASSRSAR